MKLAVLSDTHGLLRQEVLNYTQGCDAILHGGDINPSHEALQHMRKMWKDDSDAVRFPSAPVRPLEKQKEYKERMTTMPNYNEILNNFMADAYDFINNPTKLDQLLLDVEAKLHAIPKIGETVSGLPVMIAMVKSWIKKEYTVQPKALATIVAALLYLIKKNDLIPDNIPVVGIADDLAVLVAALKIIEPELDEYRKATRG